MASQTLDALLRTVPMTTPAVMVARSEQAGRLALLMRADRETWSGMTDDERSQTVLRLQFARWRLNREDRLARRCTRERLTMRKVLTNVLVVAWVALAGAEMLVRRIGGRHG